MSLLLKNAAGSDTCINRTALSYAIENGDLLSLRLLVEAGYPVETLKDGKPINYSSSPVLLAMKYGWPHILEYIFSVTRKKLIRWMKGDFPLARRSETILRVAVSSYTCKTTIPALVYTGQILNNHSHQMFFVYTT